MTSLVVAVAILLATAEAPAAPASIDRADQAAREVLDRRYQKQLPLAPLEQFGPVGHGDKTPQRSPNRAPRRAPDRAQPAFGAGVLGELFRLIAYVVLGVAVVMFGMWLLRDLRRGPADAALEGEDALVPSVDQDVLERPIGDADELARAGRYADAIHTLLLRTLIELVRATRTRVPAALTSREILARVPLVPDAREALHGLVGAVELTYFGDDVPSATDYERCRQHFQRFADAYRGAA